MEDYFETTPLVGKRTDSFAGGKVVVHSTDGMVEGISVRGLQLWEETAAALRLSGVQRTERKGLDLDNATWYFDIHGRLHLLELAERVWEVKGRPFIMAVGFNLWLATQTATTGGPDADKDPGVPIWTGPQRA